MKSNGSSWARAAAASAILTGLWMVGRPVTAQSGITITSPAANAVLPAGPDYATEVLGDPWDFSNPQDIALEPTQSAGWSSGPTVSGGLVSGVTAAVSNASLAILNRPWFMINNPGRNGHNFPIDSAKYSKLAIKFTTSRSDQFPRFFWWPKEIGDPSDPGAGTRLISENAQFSPVGTNIYVLDMINIPANSGFSGPAWNAAPIKSLAFYPNHANATNNVSVDWMRLTAGDARPEASKMSITWSGGSGTIDVTVSENSSGTTYKIGTVSASAGSVPAWNYGVLPPGAYTLHVGAASRTFTVNGPPSVQVTDPDETGGQDFATALLGNPWDMVDANDYFVNVNIVDHLTQHSPGPSGFTGTSDGQAVAFTPGGIPVGDPQLYLLSKQKPADGPVIDSTKYHRLTYTLTVDHPYNLTTGSVARVFWGSQSSPTGGGTPYDVTTTKDIIVWPGTNTYTLDLATLTTANGGLELNNAQLWTAAPVRHFRIDPFEFAEVVTFHLANVKLAADDATVNGSFLIKFAGSDPEGDPTTVDLYYDTDQNPNNGRTLIAAGIPLATGQYLWRTGTRVPAGSYFIYAVANDGHSTIGRYSSGPVTVVSAPLPSLLGGDFDGDALGDLGLYKANGDWAILTSGSGYASSIVKSWGGAGYTPVAGDYDGDGKQDIGVYREATGNWSILESSSNYTAVLSVNWGGAGYKPVPGDYDGDGKTDIGVYVASTGAWSILRSSSNFTTTLAANWGGSGYTAIGGQDFDGDGKSDMAVYQAATGTWSILKSSSGFTSSTTVTWGGGNYSLVPGDYDGDGKADLGLYQPSTGVWSILQSSSGYTSALSIGWGGAGYLPVPGDFDGDGRIDLGIFQRATGNWSILKSSTGYTASFTITGWGGPTDLPLTTAISFGGNDTTRASDFDGDGKSDITVYQASSGLWLALKSTTNYTTSMNKSWGGTGYTPVPGDYDGDGQVDLGLYQQSTGNWNVLLSGAGFTTALSKNAGGSGWVPVPADYDGDGKTDFVVYNTSTGLWYGLKSSTNYTTTLSIGWGGSGYTAAPADFDGDGKADLAVYQGATGNWLVLLSGTNFTTSMSKAVGGAGYVPVQGDFDGDGKADFAVYNTSTGLWYALKSSSNYTTTLAISWGGTGYTPVRGDFDGDGKMDLVLYQAASGGWYVLLSGSNYATTISKGWGGAGYAPVPAFP
jgi:FG-GAP-like repeat